MEELIEDVISNEIFADLDETELEGEGGKENV